MKFDAVRLRGTGPRGVVHMRTLEAITSPRRSFYAGEVLCNHRWRPEQLEPAPEGGMACDTCAKRKIEIEEARRMPSRGGTDRPFMKASVDELEKVFAQHTADPAVLGRLLEELTYRQTDRAKQLRREVQGVIGGIVPTTKPVRPAQPEDQTSLLDND